MHLVPLAISLLIAGLLTPAVLGEIARCGAVKENFAGRVVPTAAGIVVVVVALVTLAPVALFDDLADVDLLAPNTTVVVMFVLGVALLGLLDDLSDIGGDHQPRGLRGHGTALSRGRLSTGSLKAIGTVGLASLAMAGQGLTAWRYLVAVGVLTLTAHLFNLLDLRPGRAGKLFIVLGVIVPLAAWTLRPLEYTAIFIGPLLMLFPYDLGERAMLGDTGAGAIGAVVGLWFVLTMSGAAQATLLGVLAVIAIYGELRSLSGLIERTPILRQLDSWGRPSHA